MPTPSPRGKAVTSSVGCATLSSRGSDLFRRLRATFSQFESGLKISPPSGKTVIDLFDDLYTYFEAREAPLSALRATLPEGESCFRRLRDTLPKGKAVTSSVGCADTFPEGEGGDRFRRVGTLFAFGFKCRSEKFF